MSSEKIHLKPKDIIQLALPVSVRIAEFIAGCAKSFIHPNPRIKLYAVPRGGIPAAFAIMSVAKSFDAIIVDDPKDAHVIVDDIVDSGATKESFGKSFPDKPFLALIDKATDTRWKDKWVVFPWEGIEGRSDDSLTDNITRIIQFIGEDVTREGLVDTPKRVAKAWEYWASGYGQDPASVLKTFTESSSGPVDEMVIVNNIPVYSKCEHHLADIFGTATIAYIPNGRVVGLSKFSRLVDIFARRLQIQERLTNQIADALNDCIKPLGVGVIIKARHMCMESRGIRQQGQFTTTSALRGKIKDDKKARAEFIQLSKL